MYRRFYKLSHTDKVKYSQTFNARQKDQYISIRRLYGDLEKFLSLYEPGTTPGEPGTCRP